MEPKIIIKGASEHNLKNINLEIPKNKLVVFTGVSGSGKSSLVFDTIFNEAQRRYLESLSSYARQFLSQMKKARVEEISGLSPAIAISQKTLPHNPRSVVGTITEIYDYLRLLFAKIGKPYCPNCQIPIEKLTLDEIVERILDFENKRINPVRSRLLQSGRSRAFGGAASNGVKIFAPIVQGRKGEYFTLLNNLYLQGFSKVKIDGKMHDLSRKIHLSRYKLHNIDILVDTLKINAENISRISEAVEISLERGQGLVKIENRGKEIIFNSRLSCPKCGFSFSKIEPRLFSFNSPYGACEKCQGLGREIQIDPGLVIPDKKKTIAEGGILPWSWTPKNYYGALINAVCQEYDISTNVRIKDIPSHKLNLLLYGPDYEEKIRIKYYFHGQPRVFYTYFKGLIPHLEQRYQKTESEAVEKEIRKYMSRNPCPKCRGQRLKKESLSVRIGQKSIAEICQLDVSRAYEFFEKLKLTSGEKKISERILEEVKKRLKFLIEVGLSYLTLFREGETLAVGEAQRIRLASQVGSGLTGVLYILDEPTIGLHVRDINRLLDTLIHLRDMGNTVLIIEHDRATIEAADWLCDLGPGGGEFGGKIVARGSISQVLKTKTLTSQYLKGEKVIEIPPRRKIGKKFLTVKGARCHNLKNLRVDIPLNLFTCVTGVSGSGKSSLIVDTIYKALARVLYGAREKPGEFSKLEGQEFIKRVILVDQSPIGRTPRSNPATYTNVFTPIRELFAAAPLARQRGHLPGRFSFNVSGGRCEACHGAGQIKIEMQFLPDVYIPCEVCQGKRFNKETLDVKYKGKDISQILEMTITEALKFFVPHPEIKDKLKLMEEVGLGYLKLGQPATTLSGGEAQRIKLSRELSRPLGSKTLYILDEPTTGLHFDDVKKLIEVLQKLVDRGNSVILTEHNQDIIKSADWILDLGPEGGQEGGYIVAEGTPEEVAEKAGSYTGAFLKKILCISN